MRVLQDTARRLPRIENVWKECPPGPGLFVDGTFPANARISGRMVAENGEQRTFSFDLVLDD